jgi:nicotinate phosphoribosyltransferase
VEVEGRAVAKRSEHKTTQGGRKRAVRRHRPTGTATEEVLRSQAEPTREPGDRTLQIAIVEHGKRVAGLPTLNDSREHLRRTIETVPWEGLKLSRGEPAIPTTYEGRP